MESKICISLQVTYPLFLSDFNDLNFLHRFYKNTQISNFRKIRSVRAQLYHADVRTESRTVGQTDVIKLAAAFPNFPKERKTN